MKKVRTVALPVFAFAIFATNPVLLHATSAFANGSQDMINGIAMVPGVERLSYVSTQYYGVRSTYDACVKKTQGRVAEQGDCADTEFEYQDERLNRAYKALIAGLSGIDKRSAVDAQRAWLAFYAKDCAARADRFGSDVAPETESICRMESTAMRAQQLEDWRDSLSASHRQASEPKGEK